MLALRRWMQMGAYPTGLDGAQWLALGRGLHGFGRATGGVYAPLTPALATLLDAMTGPMLALRLLAALSGIAVGLAIWLTARARLSLRTLRISASVT